ncbi:MAG: cytochrome C, partial [Alphaproteobacteria bacterium]|nr:cytochrome C [Alphaproteobacteria bacterium]
MRSVILSAAFAASLLAGADAHAQQAAPIPGSVLAATCSRCHRPAGRRIAQIPPLNSPPDQQL